MTTLQNKTALVTGASRGIGRATAVALAEAGAHVLVHYGRSTREAESLVAAIETKGGRANAISADLGTPDGAALLAKQVLSIVGNRLDVLVLNAGIGKSARPTMPWAEADAGVSSEASSATRHVHRSGGRGCLATTMRDAATAPDVTVRSRSSRRLYLRGGNRCRGRFAGMMYAQSRWPERA